MISTYQYDIKTPKNMQDGKRYPLLIALHGIGYNEQYMMELFDGVTDEFILVAPRGDLSHENGYAYYYLIEYGKPDMDLFDASMGKLQTFIKDVIAAYPVDPNFVYLTGFSQGAILSNALAVVLGDTIRGIVSMNGYVPEFLNERYEVKSVKHLQVFLSDGQEDDIFPPHVGQKNEAFFKEEGANVVYTTYSTGHSIGEKNRSDAVAWLLESYVERVR